MTGVVDEFVEDIFEDIELPGLFTCWLGPVSESIRFLARKLLPFVSCDCRGLVDFKLLFFTGDVDRCPLEEPTLFTEAVVEMGMDEPDALEFRYGDGVLLLLLLLGNSTLDGVVASGV